MRSGGVALDGDCRELAFSEMSHYTFKCEGNLNSLVKMKQMLVFLFLFYFFLGPVSNTDNT